jgi:hypothetical protein
MKIPLPGTDDWGDLFWHLSHQVQKDKVVLVLDEIRWIQHLHICSNLIAKTDYNS